MHYTGDHMHYTITFHGKHEEVHTVIVEGFDRQREADENIVDVNEKTLDNLRDESVEGSRLPKHWKYCMEYDLGCEVEPYRPDVDDVEDETRAAQRRLRR